MSVSQLVPQKKKKNKKSPYWKNHFSNPALFSTLHVNLRRALYT